MFLSGALKIKALSPVTPIITVVNQGRDRIDISGGTTGYVVELTDR